MCGEHGVRQRAVVLLGDLGEVVPPRRALDEPETVFELFADLEDDVIDLAAYERLGLGLAAPPGPACQPPLQLWIVLVFPLRLKKSGVAATVSRAPASLSMCHFYRNSLTEIRERVDEACTGSPGASRQASPAIPRQQRPSLSSPSGPAERGNSPAPPRLRTGGRRSSRRTETVQCRSPPDF